MKNRLSGILTLLLALIVQVAFAQQKSVTGTVTDAQGMPLPGVNIVIDGTNRGTQTDFEGEYNIQVVEGETLVYTYLGFARVERTVGNASTINITMEEDASALSEVVVVGYGTRDKTDVVGSVAQINAEQLEDRPSANVLDAMQGKVPGLQIFSSSGEPSGTPSIRLHGAGSLGAGSTPLILLDGFPIDEESLVSLNTQDIQDVTVLKDASATAIYGSRAANGVVYITTKTGRKEQDPRINVSYQYGISNMANTDPFDRMMNTEQLSGFFVDAGIYSQEQMSGILEQYPYDTHWEEYFYKQDVPTSQINASVTGGSEKTSYYFSAGYFEQEGLAYRSDFERYTLRSNVTTEVNDWLDAGLNLSIGYDERQVNPYGSNQLNRGLAMLRQPWYSPINPETGERYQGVIPGMNAYDPEYLADMNPAEDNRVQFNPSAFVQLTPFEGFTLRTQAGLEAFDRRGSAQRLPSFLGNLNNGTASESFARAITQTFTNTAEYKFDIEEQHNITVLAGHEFIDYDFETFSASSEGQTDDRLIMLGQGPENRSVGQSKNEYVFESFFGRLSYDFSKKYYIDFTLRQDGSSRFGADNRYANFWAVGAMWKIKEESFMQDYDWLNELTLRTSIGTSGNADIGNYNSLALVGTNQYAGQTGWGLSSAGNPALSWESQEKFTVGVSLGLLDRVRLDVEYYNRVTNDMLIDVPYPFTSGFSQITSNVGSLKNSGFDVSLDFDIVRNQDWYVTPYVNFNYNKNEVTELFQGKDHWIIPNTGVSWAVGQPVSFFYPVWAGVNSETGEPQWYVPHSDPDQVVNPNLDPNNVTSTFSPSLEQNTGIKRYPPWNGGFGVNAGWKGFYVGADFTFSEGKYLINNDRYFFENPYQFAGYNQYSRVLDYWQQPGDETTFPSLDHQFTQFDSRLIEDASFVRLKTLTVGYNLPRSVTEQIGFIDNMKIYFIGRNLATWTDYLGPDPEVDTNLALGTNPNTKQFTFGVDFQF